MFDPTILKLASNVLDAARSKKIQLATAESCTAGLIVGALTEIAGSSDVVDRGFATYSNKAKEAVLGVPAAMIAEHGAVSRQVAAAMAQGARARAGADHAIAISQT